MSTSGDVPANRALVGAGCKDFAEGLSKGVSSAVVDLELSASLYGPLPPLAMCYCSWRIIHAIRWSQSAAGSRCCQPAPSTVAAAPTQFAAHARAGRILPPPATGVRTGTPASPSRRPVREAEQSAPPPDGTECVQGPTRDDRIRA